MDEDRVESKRFEGRLKIMPPGQPAPQVPGSPGSKSTLGVIIGFLTGIIGLGGGYALVPSYI